MERILSAYARGAVAAIVNAGMGSVTEPIVNTVLVKRVPVHVALQEFDVKRSWKMFYEATLPTNLIRFPFYEIVAALLRGVPIPHTWRGLVTGIVYTTSTLPLGNYRFMKSVRRKITTRDLFKAYWPTLFRDVIYSVVRANVDAALRRRYPTLQRTAFGRFFGMFLTALVACIVSSPGNEMRGYALQSDDSSRLTFREFFRPQKYVRSTAVGATNIALSLGTGALIVEPLRQVVERLRSIASTNPGLVSVCVLLMIRPVVGAWARHRRIRKHEKNPPVVAADEGRSRSSSKDIDAVLDSITAPPTPLRPVASGPRTTTIGA